MALPKSAQFLELGPLRARAWSTDRDACSAHPSFLQLRSYATAGPSRRAVARLHGCRWYGGRYFSEGGGGEASRFQPSAGTARNPPAPQSVRGHRPWPTALAGAPPHRRNQPAEPLPSPSTSRVSESAQACQNQGFLEVSSCLIVPPRIEIYKN